MTRLHAVDYEQGKALFQVGERFVVVDTKKRDVDEVADTKEALTAAAWLKVSSEFSYPDVWGELAEAAVTTLSVEEEEKPSAIERKFRVPDAVKEEALQAITWVTGFERANSTIGMAVAKKLVESTYITQSEISRIYRYFSRISGALTEAAGWSPGENGYPTDERIRYAMRGGDAGREWVNKIATKHPITAAGEEMDVDGNVAHEFVDDPDVPGFCEVCGREAADEIHTVEAPSSQIDEIDEDGDYFGKGSDPDSTYVTELYRRNDDTTWEMYDGTGWVSIEEPAEDAVVILLDPDSVKTLMNFIRDRDPENQEAGIELSMLNPHEAALFALAESEIDWELVDRMFDIYDSQERSVNAKRQVRAPGGRFGENPDSEEKKAAGVPKARLSAPMPLVQDVAALIQQYLSGSTDQQEPAVQTDEPGGAVTAAALNAAIDSYNFVEVASRQIHELAEAVPQGDAGGQTAPAVQAQSQDRPLYLAIVDAVDTEAVLDVVAIMPGPVCWKRDAGQWVQAPDLLQQMQGTQPPPVVELKEDTIIADVLQQVDKSTSSGADETETETPGATEQRPDGSSGARPDANPDQHPVAAAALPASSFKGFPAEKREKLGKKGFALPDGSFPIENAQDLKNAVKAYGRAKNQAAAKRHIIKRARALRRLDLLPSDWSKDNAAHEYAMYGPHGEMMNLVAAGEGGADRNRGGAEKLRRYWETGEGGTVKIRWNTPGDWTRCYRHLRKYMGVRAKGYCTLRHHAMTGRWPGERDQNGNL